MIEVDEKSLEEGNYYIFWKKYANYYPDIYIGEFIGYNNDKDHNIAICRNSMRFRANHDHRVDVRTYFDNRPPLSCKLSSLNHMVCWCFKLDNDEIQRHILMENL